LPSNRPLIRFASRALASALLCFLHPGCIAFSQQTPNTSVADLRAILARMNDAASRVRTVSASLEYTTVTVLVNDRTTEYGKLLYRSGKKTAILIHFEKPDPKFILFKKHRAQIYLPRTNQVQEYDLGRKSGLLQQFLLLGFGTDVDQLEASYRVKYLREAEVGNKPAVVLELTPREKAVAAQLTKVDLSVSRTSWLPVEQQFYEASGDYLIARYRKMEINRPLAASTFRLHASKSAERVRMN